MSYTYDELNHEMGDRERMPIKKTRAQTYAQRLDDGGIGIYLYWTRILEFRPSGRVILSSGGYETATTKARINDYLPPFWGVHQKNHEWYLHNWKLDKTWPFIDGIVINDGDVEDGV